MTRSTDTLPSTQTFAEYASRPAIPMSLGQRIPVTYQAAHQLQQMILDGVWSDGMRLPAQRELSERLGVSRASLREALSVLETLGLLSIEPGRGVFVRTRVESSEDPVPMVAGRYTALDVFQVRFALNSLAATLATTRISDSGIDQLQQITVAMREALERSDFQAVSEQDFAFHSVLFSSCGNEMLLDMTNTVQQERYDSTTLAAKDRAGLHLAVDEHQAVVDALGVRDAAKARLAIETHIRNAAIRSGIDLTLVLV